MKQTITLGLAAAMVSWFAQPVYADHRGGGGGGAHVSSGGAAHFSGGGGAHFSGGGARFGGGGGATSFVAPSTHYSAQSFHAPSVGRFSTAPQYGYRSYGTPRSSTTFAPSISNQNRAFVQPRQSVPTMAFGGNSVTRSGRAGARAFAAPAEVSRGWDRGHMHAWNHHHFRFFNGNWFIVDNGFYGPYGYGYADDYPYASGYGYGYDQPYYNNYGDTYATPAPAIALSEGLVATVQNQLTRLGYVVGPADGVFGQLTQNALANFQRDHNLSVTGQLDQITLQALGVPYD